ncbi:MAG: O-antigen ligase family protein [Burkholderiaceae bacterium]
MNARARRTAVLTVAATGAAAVVLGLAIVLLPMPLKLALAAVVLGSGALLVTRRLPALADPPRRRLLWMFIVVYTLYFAWPRAAFLPILALPIKHPQKLLYYGFVLLWCVVMIRSDELRRRLADALSRHRGLSATIAFMLCWRIAAAVAATHPFYSLPRVIDEIVSLYLAFVIVVSLVDDERDARRLIAALIAVALFNVSTAIPEVAWRRNVFEPFITLNLLDPGMAQQIVGEKLRAGAVRAQAAFSHPLLFAEFLAVLIPFQLAAWITSRRRWRHALLGLGMVLGIVLARTRTGMLVAALGVVGMSVLVALLNRRRADGSAALVALGLPTLAVCAILFAMLAAPLIVGRSLEEMGSSYARVRMLYASLPMIARHPLLGHGPALGAYELDFRSAPEGVRTLDSHLLLAALDAGIPYLAAFVAVIAGTAWTLIRHARATRPPSASIVFACAAVCATMGFLAFKLILGTDQNNSLMFVLAGLAVALDRSSRESGGVRDAGGRQGAGDAVG